MIVGGAMLYASAIAYCQTMWLTRVLTTLEGDVYFPKMDWREWHMLSSEAVPAGPQDEWPSEFQVWQRNLVA